MLRDVHTLLVYSSERPFVPHLTQRQLSVLSLQYHIVRAEPKKLGVIENGLICSTSPGVNHCILTTLHSIHKRIRHAEVIQFVVWNQR